MMRIRGLWLTLVCLSALSAASMQSLSVAGATLDNSVQVAPSFADHISQDEEMLYLPLTKKDGPDPSPSPTSSPTSSPSPTVEPSPSPTIEADLFVDDSNTTNTEDGSPEHPFSNIQAAIAAAPSEGETTIAVAAGVYTENVRIQDKTLHLFGGFVGGTQTTYTNGDSGNFNDRNTVTNVSHIKGDKTDSVVTLIDVNTSTVDGFRITDGTRSLEPEFGELGGGFYVTGGSPTISNNLIENNETPLIPNNDPPAGGGIFAGNSDISILNNIIRDNISGRGAGIAVNGGMVIIRDNTVQDNKGESDHGGGLYIAAPQAEITRNLIKGNEIGREFGYGWGGGIIVFNQGSFATLSFNIITENYAPSVGSGVFIDDGAIATLDHELIYNNDCPDGGTQGGVGVYVDGYGETIGSEVTIIHSTIASHNCDTANNGGGNGLYVEGNSIVTITNSIFWDNNGDDFFVLPNSNSNITITYSIMEEAIAGAGNLFTDPLFANPNLYDYHLQSTVGRWDSQANGGNGAWVVDAKHSPAIDAADPASPFADEPTPNGSRANMGVYGNTTEASKSTQ